MNLSAKFRRTIENNVSDSRFIDNLSEGLKQSLPMDWEKISLMDSRRISLRQSKRISPKDLKRNPYKQTFEENLSKRFEKKTFQGILRFFSVNFKANIFENLTRVSLKAVMRVSPLKKRNSPGESFRGIQNKFTKLKEFPEGFEKNLSEAF